MKRHRLSIASWILIATIFGVVDLFAVPFLMNEVHGYQRLLGFLLGAMFLNAVGVLVFRILDFIRVKLFVHKNL